MITCHKKQREAEELNTTDVNKMWPSSFGVCALLVRSWTIQGSSKLGHHLLFTVFRLPANTGSLDQGTANILQLVIC
jgi:hypothetical protein